MSDKNIEMMKKLLEKKNEQQKQKQKQNYRSDKKIGTAHKGKMSQKTGGSNNKV